ncbi:hypothetical protein [Dyadobacter pollutisoli]|jgi:hypothetical protein|uniref:Uncharacterized protein n=1 Tax=Dyadobacter pollutisoli TaxID=2910158 RepID=A0A9E8NCK3_9BACT|nr:hypothetical protein [Dyadobacter pollutisoli]WAC11892.1 hypothetical protein ON006_29695 [Dyadobacter pollutisoli]
MPITKCNICGGTIQWNWEEAFCKFGFSDGDGQIETYTVEDTLTEAGYEVVVQDWGMHNTIITSIKRNGIEQIPDQVTVGYDDPREYLPKRIVKLLNKQFPSETPYFL